MTAGGEPRDVPVSRLGTEVRLVGTLHQPLGNVLTVQGVIVHSRGKGDDGRPMFRVQRIDGRAAQEDLTIEVQPGWIELGAKLPEPRLGTSLEGVRDGWVRRPGRGRRLAVPRQTSPGVNAMPRRPTWDDVPRDPVSKRFLPRCGPPGPEPSRGAGWAVPALLAFLTGLAVIPVIAVLVLVG